MDQADHSPSRHVEKVTLTWWDWLPVIAALGGVLNAAMSNGTEALAWACSALGWTNYAVANFRAKRQGDR